MNSGIRSLPLPLRQPQLRLALPLVSLVLSLLLSRAILLALLSLALYPMLLYLEPPGSRMRRLRQLLLLAAFVSVSILPVMLVRQSDAVLELLWGWGVSRESLSLGLVLWLRCMSAVGSLLLLLSLVPIYELCRELRRIGVPQLLVELFELTYRYIHVLQETTKQIALAQTARLGWLGWRAKLRDLPLLLSQTFILTYHEAEALYEGLLSRAYAEGDSPSPFPTDQPPIQMDTTSALVSLRGIGFAYEARQAALRGIDLELFARERIVLLGKNGAGKSSLMYLLAGLRLWTQGQILLGTHTLGRGRSDLPQLRRQVGLVLQNSNHQLFCPSVEDELAFGLRNLGLSDEEVRRRVEALIADYELEELRHRPPHELSEGQKKWVSIISVLALDPPILLLDEPTASLDCYFTDRVIDLLSRLNDEGKTILLSTHDMELAYRWGRRAVVLVDGSIAADTSVEEVFADEALLRRASLRPVRAMQPLHPDTTSLIPSPSEDYSLPLFLASSKHRALIIGGGSGAWIKARGLIDRGVEVSVISPEVCPELAEAILKGRCRWIARPFGQGEEVAPHYSIVVAATGDEALDGWICLSAARQGQLYAHLGHRGLGNFHFAWSAKQGNISLATHTDQALPEVSRALGQYLLAHLPTLSSLELDELAQLRHSLSELRRSAEPLPIELEHRYDELRATILARLEALPSR